MDRKALWITQDIAKLVSKWLYTLHNLKLGIYIEWYIDLVNIYKLPFRCCLAADGISYRGLVNAR